MRLSPHLLLGLVPALGACAVSAGAAVRDLAALHEPEDWSHRSPAKLEVPPESWLSGSRAGLRVGEDQWFDIEDHRPLEEAILQQLAVLSADDFPLALEASAWLSITLLHDEYPESRLVAGAILSQLGGRWIEVHGARLGGGESGDLGAALAAFNAATDTEDLALARQRSEDALILLDQAPLGDALQATRVLSGVGRRLGRFEAPWPGEAVLARLGARAVVLALERAAADPDPAVAAACQDRLELLQSHAR